MSNKTENIRANNDSFFLNRKALYPGMILAGLSVVGLILNIAINNSIAIFNHSETRPNMVVINSLINIGLVVGLLIIGATKVREEDELVKVQRLNAFLIAMWYVGFNSLSPLIFNALVKAPVWQNSNADLVITFLMIYLAVFYIQRWRRGRSMEKNKLPE